jgi:hypothetical protein
MLVNLFVSAILGLGLVIPGVTAEQKPLDCCAAKLACCQKNLPCCQSATKPACCQKGEKCCAEGKACCMAAHQASVKGTFAQPVSLKGPLATAETKTCSCCAMKSTTKTVAQIADCCKAKLACCDAKLACCSTDAKAACCQSGEKCCSDKKACCSAKQK